jgi:hypothetical protein
MRFAEYDTIALRQIYNICDHDRACSAIRKSSRGVRSEALPLLRNHLADFSPALIAQFLDETARLPRGDFLLRAKELKLKREDTIRLGRNLDIADIDEQIARLTAPGELDRMHDRLIARYNRGGRRVAGAEKPKDPVAAFIAEWGTNTFPKPPFAGNDVIVPVRTIEELVDEGKIMAHCVGTYGTTIMNKRCSIYKVLAPERATFELKHFHSTLGIGQLKCEKNREPTEETKRVVRAWLDGEIAGQMRK